MNRPLSLAAVQRRLAAGGHRVSVVAPFRGNGQFHVLVITASSARYIALGPDFGLEPLLHRMIGDLNVLADHRILPALRRVADHLAAGRAGPRCAVHRRSAVAVRR